MMIGMDLTIDGVGLYIEGDEFECVSMHEERVALREVDGYSAVCTHGITCVLVVLAIVACELITIDGVDIDYIIESLAEAHLTIIVDAVAYQHLSPVGHHRTVHQPRPFQFGVVKAQL